MPRAPDPTSLRAQCRDLLALATSTPRGLKVTFKGPDNLAVSSFIMARGAMEDPAVRAITVTLARPGVLHLTLPDPIEAEAKARPLHETIPFEAEE